MATYRIMDPFAGSLVISGDNLMDAIKRAYADIPPEEIPTHVWHDNMKGDRQQIDLPFGKAKPNF